MDGLEGLPPRGDSAPRTEVRGATAVSSANIPEAEATGEAGRARVRDQSPPEGGANAREDEIARLRLDNLKMQIRLEVQAEERERAERAQQERQRLGGGGMDSQRTQQRSLPGTVIVGYSKPAP